MSAPETLPPIDTHVLRFITCGSVDDGKSTLIGRLLYDTRAILADTLHAIEHSSRRRGLDAPDLSLLTDGLQAEREQGITIDVAHRYFSTGRRKYIIADAPGHEQYTRNMVTAASTADAAVILVDARKGILTQTRRHAAIAHLLEVPRLVVAVNKMDLVGWDRTVFERICDDFGAFARSLGAVPPEFVPISALGGDMVVDRGEALRWHQGPTLLELLESLPSSGGALADQPLRFPVQWVCRPQASADPALHDYRGYAGRVEAGRVAPGDDVIVLPAGVRTRIRAVEIAGQPIAEALPGQSVTLRIDGAIDISRGDLFAAPAEPPRTVRRIEAMLCWLGEKPLDSRRRYLVRHTTRDARAAVSDILYRLDIDTLEQRPADGLAMNDIGKVALSLAQPLCVDDYARSRAGGAFILVDESSNDTVAAGLVVGP
jgi:sulfate adenylyltransferase subunit 1